MTRKLDTGSILRVAGITVDSRTDFTSNDIPNVARHNTVQV